MKIQPTPVLEIVDVCDLAPYRGCVLKHVQHNGAMTEHYLVAVDENESQDQIYRLFNLCDGTELPVDQVTGSLVYCPNAFLTP